MSRARLSLVGLTLVLIVVSATIAQRRGRRDDGPRWSDDGRLLERGGVELWDHDPKFASDVFTFVRIRFFSWRNYRYGREDWMIDSPDSEMNFSFRLQQLTALKVDPVPMAMELTDERLFDYPFIYVVEPGYMELTEEEVVALRRYLLNGGFLMVDDFWGEDEWGNFRDQLRRVFPDRDPEDVDLSHPIFHIVYDLTEKPQIPSINVAMSGRTWERYDAQVPHYRAVYDDNERMMVFICHNTDLGDGWEREGVDEWYFREFSEKKAYPLGINIVTYAMTH